MNIEEYKIILAKNMSSNSYKKGKRCFNGKLVSKVKENLDEEFNALDIYGSVQSESEFNVYSTNISIDLNNNSLVYTSCECLDFEKNSETNSPYFCKHLVATGLAYLEKMNTKLNEDKFSIWKENGYSDSEKMKNKVRAIEVNEYMGEDIGTKLLEDLKIIDNNKNILNIDIYITIGSECEYRESKFYEVDFKIGLDKLYVMKDIEGFITASNKGLTLDYGKNFTYNPKIHHFSERDEKIISFIEEQVEINNTFSNSYRRYGLDIVKGKILKLLPNSMERFLRLISHRGVHINYEGEENFYHIREEHIPLEIEIIENEDNIELKNIMAENPKKLDYDGSVFLYKDSIYLTETKQKATYGKLFGEIINRESINFKKESIEDLFIYIIPKLEKEAKTLKIDSKISERIVKEELKLEFYLDKNRSNIWINMKAIYGNISFDYAKGYNKKSLIIRDVLKEEETKELLEDYRFVIESGKFVFKGSDEDLYYFLKDGIADLEALGAIYYSESFNKHNIYRDSSIKAEIRESEGGYLEFSFEVGDVKDEEIKNIIRALKVNKKFYKLKSGNFISLDDKSMGEFFSVLDDLTVDNSYKKKMKIHKSRALYLSKELSEDSIIMGRNILLELGKNISNLNKVDYTIPKEFNGILRDYQNEGFRWFKNLSTYGFGGVLADEMGLGKTIQTIAFLLSEKEKKTIIVTPTSLIYNWKDEFEKFAPTLKILLLHGDKVEREEAMRTYEHSNYDIILTTYGTLKNDFEFYKGKSFDFSIIDEGQNIKNYNSLSSEAVKAIDAKQKFALTGTPIENNLMELWSIFDYVMPTYLYSKTKFQEKFMGKEKDLSKLKEMIKPFTLRRLKKDVMKELPSKIEKKFFVEMSENQKKVYKTFAEDIKQKLINKEEDNKITILAYLTKLRQICLDPSLIMEDYEGDNGKLDIAMEIIRDRIENDKKILLFSQFTSVLGIIKKELEYEGISYYYLDGSTKASSRVEMVNSFNEDEEKKVFLISLKAGGTGLNLTSASTVVHFDPWWNPAIEEQATDRAHRMGQKSSVEVIKLIGKGTIEEKILKLQESKKEIIDNIMSNSYENGTLLSTLSEDEIIKLFE